MPTTEQASAIKCLFSTLLKYYGGKQFYAVPKSFILLCEELDFSVVPRSLEDNTKMYERLLYLNSADSLINRLNPLASRLEKLKERYKVLMDKSLLMPRCEEISKLLINNTTWAGAHLMSL